MVRKIRRLPSFAPNFLQLDRTWLMLPRVASRASSIFPVSSVCEEVWDTPTLEVQRSFRTFEPPSGGGIPPLSNNQQIVRSVATNDVCNSRLYHKTVLLPLSHHWTWTYFSLLKYRSLIPSEWEPILWVRMSAGIKQLIPFLNFLPLGL